MGLVMTPTDLKQYLAQGAGTVTLLQYTAKHGRVFGIFGKSPEAAVKPAEQPPALPPKLGPRWRRVRPVRVSLL